MVGIAGVPTRPARLAFAMARHAAADLSHILGTRPQPADPGRLQAADLSQLRALLAEAGIPLREGPEADKMLAHLRQMYEPFVSALADRLLMPLPSWLPTPEDKDVWRVTAWGTEAWSITRDKIDST
jgi:hypothetical protein